MKMLAFSVVLASIACSKAPASASSPTGTPGAGPAAPSGTPVPAAPAPAPAPKTKSSAAVALEDFDRVFAPIWKLSDGARVRAACQHRELLRSRLDALPRGVAPGWDDEVGHLATLVQDLDRYCPQIPTEDFASDAKMDLHTADFPDSDGQRMRESYTKLVALVPDAVPAGTHQGDPMPPSDGGAVPESSGKVVKLRSALMALDDRLAKLETAAHAAKTRADACKGVDKLPPLYQALRKPDLVAGPPKAKDWAMRLDDLGMAIGDTTDNKCGPDSTAEVEDLQDRYASLRKNVSGLIALCK